MIYLLDIRQEGQTQYMHLANVDFNELSTSYSRISDELRGRVKLGEVSVYGNSYEQIKSLSGANLEYVLFENGEELGRGVANLLTNEDIDYKIIKLELIIEDVYTNFDKKGDTLYNINEVPDAGLGGRIEVIQEVEKITVTFTPTSQFRIPTVSDPTLYWIPDLIALETEIGRPDWNVEASRITWQVVCMGHHNAPDLQSLTCEIDYMRYVAYGYYNGASRTPPQIAGNWVFVEDVIINNTKIPKYADIYTTGLIADNSWFTWGFCAYTAVTDRAVWSSDNMHHDIPSPSDLAYNLASESIRRYDDVIKFLVGKINPLVNFDNTGTLTDSFYSNKNIKSSVINIAGWGYTNDLPYKDLMVMNVNDLIPTDAGVQGSELSTLTQTSFNRFMQFFEKLGFYWLIENRSGQYYFILKHYSHRGLGIAGEMLNYTFTEKTRKIEVEPSLFDKITNNEQVQGIDFVGTSVTFQNVKDTNTALELVSNNIFTDVDYIAVYGNDDFNRLDSEQIVIFAGYVDYYPANFVGIRPQISVLTGIQKNNSELSHAYLSGKMYCKFPDKNFETNGNSFVAENYKVKKREKIKLTLPLNKVKYFDLSKMYIYLGDNVEVTSVSRKGTDNFTDITILK